MSEFDPTRSALEVKPETPQELARRALKDLAGISEQAMGVAREAQR